MEKLDKVIAGLRNCSYPSENCYYSDCPYRGKRDADKVCQDFLIEDALERLEWTKVQKGTILEMGREYRKLEEKLAAVKAERDDLRKDVAVLAEDLRKCREKLSWLEPRTAPNDWGEYPPEFPGEGM